MPNQELNCHRAAQKCFCFSCQCYVKEEEINHFGVPFKRQQSIKTITTKKIPSDIVTLALSTTTKMWLGLCYRTYINIGTVNSPTHLALAPLQEQQIAKVRLQINFEFQQRFDRSGKRKECEQQLKNTGLKREQTFSSGQEATQQACPLLVTLWLSFSFISLLFYTWPYK